MHRRAGAQLQNRGDMGIVGEKGGNHGITFRSGHPADSESDVVVKNHKKITLIGIEPVSRSDAVVFPQQSPYSPYLP
jgi:hypothetical protein